MLNHAKLVSAMLLVPIASATALAQGVGPGGPFETTHILQSGGTIDPSPAVRIVRIGGTDSPIPVELDPLGPAWMKHLDGAYGIDPGKGIALTERLRVSGQRSWTGWREEIMTPGFTWWQSDTLNRFDVYMVGPAPGLTVDYAPSGSAPGSVLEFSFADLTPGTQISTGAILVYTGTAPFTGTTVTIRSYPTPEPGSCGLLSVGGAVLFGRRRRRLL